MLHQANALDRGALGAVNAYNPGLSSAWMLQRAMSVRPAPHATVMLTLVCFVPEKARDVCRWSC